MDTLLTRLRQECSHMHNCSVDSLPCSGRIRAFFRTSVVRRTISKGGDVKRPGSEIEQERGTLAAFLNTGRPSGSVETLTLGGFECPITRRGSGQPIICIHGLGHDQWDYAPLFERAQAGFELIALDLPGFGLAQKRSAKQTLPTFNTLVEAVRELVAQCCEPPILVGSSLGGHVAMQLALNDPTSILGMILVSPGGLRKHSADEANFFREYYSYRGIKNRSPAEIKTNNRRIFATPSQQSDELSLRKLAVHSSPENDSFAAAFASVVDDVLNYSVEDTLSELKTPFVFIFGEHDLVVSPALGIATAKRLNKEIHLISGASHIPMVERPNEFAQIVFGSSRGFQSSPKGGAEC